MKARIKVLTNFSEPEKAGTARRGEEGGRERGPADAGPRRAFIQN